MRGRFGRDLPSGRHGSASQAVGLSGQASSPSGSASGAAAARRRLARSRSSLEVVLEPDEVLGQRQAHGLHLGQLLAQGLLQLVRVGRVRAISSSSIAICTLNSSNAMRSPGSAPAASVRQ